MDKKRIYKISFIVLMALIWQLIATSGLYPKTIMPDLMMIVRRFVVLTINDCLLMKALYSVGVVFMTMVMSLLLALTFSIISIKSIYVQSSMEVLNTLLGPIPGIAVLPIVILWFGVSWQAMIIIMIHAMIWPLWTHVALALRRVVNRYDRLIKAFKIPFKRRVRHIYFEGIFPDVVAGLEIAWSRGWRALLSVEMIFGLVGSQSGLGWLIYERRMYMDTAGMFAGLLAIAICGIAFETLLFKSKKLEVYFGETPIH